MRKFKELFVIGTCLAIWAFIICGWTDTIDTSLPGATDDPREADDNMRRIQGGFQELLNVDHIFDETGTAISGADSGEHRKILFHAPRTGSSTIAANHGELHLFDRNSKAELHWTDEDENEIQITTAGILNSFNLTGNQVVTGSKTFLGVTTLATGALMASSTAPTGDAEIANKKYVDDQSDFAFSSQATTNSLGAAMAKETTYKAATDGYIMCHSTSNTNHKLVLYCSSSKTDVDAKAASTVIDASITDNDVGQAAYCGVGGPVPDDYYFRVDGENVGAITLKWISIGTLSRPVAQ